eukprot:Hpha_TRINITY_DN15136_c3_g8::TRINITY_DN15136_c3_g8_i1::g.129012::m.129012
MLGMWCGSILELLVRPHDTHEDVQIKKHAFPVCAFLFLLCGVNALLGSDESYTYKLGFALCAFGPGVFIVGVALNLGRVGVLLDAVLVVNTLGVCVLDLAAAAMSFFRPWCFVVLILDAALVFNRNHIPPLVIPLLLVYFAAETIESTHKYGLYELGLWGTDGSEKKFDCASPPCSMAVVSAGGVLVSMCAVFLIDFHFTRGFATSTRFQLGMMKAAVAVSGEIAAALASFDVARASEVLNSETASCLPHDMQHSYRRLVEQFGEFKQTLPVTALKGQDTRTLEMDKMTTEQPQFERLQKLFLSMLSQTGRAPLEEMLRGLQSPLESSALLRSLSERAITLGDRAVVLGKLGFVQLLALHLYTMEGVDLDACAGFESVPEWLELQEFCESENEREEALELWVTCGKDAEAAKLAAASRSKGVQKLVALFSDGLLERIEGAQTTYHKYKESVGATRNSAVYQRVCSSLRTLQQAEGSVPAFVAAFNELLSQGLINYIAVLCVCTVSTSEVDGARRRSVGAESTVST